MIQKRSDKTNLSDEQIWLLKWIMAQPKFEKWMEVVKNGIEVDLEDILSNVIKKKSITNKEINEIRNASFLKNLETYKIESSTRNDVISVLLIDKLKELIDALPKNVLSWPKTIKISDKETLLNIDMNVKAKGFLEKLENEGRIFSDAINFWDNWIAGWRVIRYFKESFWLSNLTQVRKKINSFNIPLLKVSDNQERFPWIDIVDRLYKKSEKLRPKTSIKDTMQITVPDVDDQIIGEILSLREFLKIQNHEPEDVHVDDELLGRLFKKLENWYDLYTVGSYDGTIHQLLNVFVKAEEFKNPIKIWTINKLSITEKKYNKNQKDPRNLYSISAEVL